MAYIVTAQKIVVSEIMYNPPESGEDTLEYFEITNLTANEFKLEGCKVCGVEPSGEFLEFIHKKGYEAYEALDELPNDRKFDLIVHFFVFEHISNPFEFIESQLKLLKDGGAIVAEIPSATDPLTSLYTIPAFEKLWRLVFIDSSFISKAKKSVCDFSMERRRFMSRKVFSL